MRKEGIIKGRDDAGGHFKGEGWCMQTLQKGGMVWKGGIIKGRDDARGRYKRRDDAGGHYKRCMRTLEKERDGEEGGHYIREA